MPQLDSIAYNYQIIITILTFIGLYVIMANQIVPLTSRILWVRNFKLDNYHSNLSTTKIVKINLIVIQEKTLMSIY